MCSLELIGNLSLECLSRKSEIVSKVSEDEEGDFGDDALRERGEGLSVRPKHVPRLKIIIFFPPALPL